MNELSALRSLALSIVVATASVLTAVGPAAAAGGNTVYLPNITRMLGGVNGWQTPFIVQNVGASATAVTLEFFAFSDGALVKTRNVASLAPANSFFHDPNSDTELPAGGQFSVVVRSTASPVVVVVNEHQNVGDTTRQEALSYQGLAQGSTSVYAPYFANSVAGWLTTLIVQDLGTQPTTVTLRFVSVDGTKTATLTRSLQPGRASFVDPRFEPLLVAGTEYSVTLTAPQPLGVVVNAHNDAPTVAAPRGFSYNGSPANDYQSNFLPYVAKNSDGRTTRLFVQNVATRPLTPRLLLCPLSDTSCPGQNFSPPAAIAPGSVWVLDLAATSLRDGEYSVYSYSETGEANYVAMLAATTGATTAMGHSSVLKQTKWYLPNITRTLGGPSGWTTPFIIQSTSAAVTHARLSWYRFADGVLVAQASFTGLQGSTALRIDPRSVPGLADNTQYAVVVDAPNGGVSVVVTELNFQGGDGVMSYEAFETPETGGFGTTSCTPSAAPAGTTFHCRFYGLTPGASPVTFTRTSPIGGATTGAGSPIAADGSTSADYLLTTQGVWTLSVTAGGVTTSTTATVLPANFALSTTQSRNGFVSAQTKAGIMCTFYTTEPDGTISPYFFKRNVLTATSDATGVVSFTYPLFSSPPGTWRNVVRCTSGSETLVSSTTFTVP